MSVDRSSHEPTIVRAPHRQFARSPVPTGRVVVDADVDRVAEIVADRIKEIRRARGQATLVFAAPDGQVYAAGADSVAADVLEAGHPDWFVGSYAGQTAAGVKWCPQPAEIADDLREHFAGIGRRLGQYPEQMTLWGWTPQRARRLVAVWALR